MDHALWFVLAFLGALALYGLWHARRVKTGDDFAVAGRRLGPTVVIGTLVATWIGTGSLFGNADFTVRHGLAAFFLPLSGAAGIALLAFLAPRARSIPASSVPEILGLRFGRAAQLLGACALIGAYLVIVSYQYRAGAAIAVRLFPERFDVDTRLLVIGFAAFIIIYTALAGMISVAWTDLVNGVLMSVGLLVALGWSVAHWDRAAAPLPAELAQWHGNEPPMAWIGFLLPAFLLVLGDANLYQRFISCNSPRTARRAAIGMFVGVLVLELAVIALALLATLMLDEPPANPGHAIIDLAFTVLPPWIGILIITTATAVIVTTADSYLLGASTSVAVDLRKGLTTPWRQRLIVVGLGLIAIGLAFTSDEFFSVALYAYTLYGASLTPAVLCALLWPRTPAAGVAAGMAAGLGTALVWKLLIVVEQLPGWLADFDPVLPALLMNVLTLVAVSLVRPRGPAMPSSPDTPAL